MAFRVMYPLEFFLQALEVLVRKLFEIHQTCARAFDTLNQLVEFQVNRDGVAVLRVLNQEDHQERDNRGAGVDD